MMIFPGDDEEKGAQEEMLPYLKYKPTLSLEKDSRN